MAEKLQKGWLKTREGNKFAPATLIENVYDRTGVDYDTAIKKYIADNFGNTNQALDGISKDIDKLEGDVTSLQAQDQALAARLTNFDGSDSNVLYIIDGNNQVIAKVDEAGVHSTNIHAKENVFSSKGNLNDTIDVVATHNQTLNDITPQIATNKEDIQKLEERLENFNGEDSNILYIVDNQNRVIAKVNDQGVTSIDMVATNAAGGYTVSLVDTEARVSDLEQVAEDQDKDLEKLNSTVSALKTVVNWTGESVPEGVNARISGAEGRAAADAQAKADAAKSAILGGASADYNTLKKAEDKIKGNATAIEQLSKEIDNVSNIMNFVGVSSTDPSSIYDSEGVLMAVGTVTINGVVITPKTGDVTIYNEIEYVYSDDEWHEFGDASGNAAAITALDGRVNTLEEWKTDTVDPALDDHEKRLGDVEPIVDSLITKTNNLDASNGSDTFYILDNQDNVIAKVNDQGVTSIDMIATALDEEGKAKYSYSFKEIAEKTISNETAIGIINGSEEGSIKKAVADLQGETSTYHTLAALEDAVEGQAQLIDTINGNENKVGSIKHAMAEAKGHAEAKAGAALTDAKAYTDDEIEKVIGDNANYTTLKSIETVLGYGSTPAEGSVLKDIDELQGRFSTLDTTIAGWGSMTDIMNYLGEKSTTSVTNPQKGDVVTTGGLEYIYTGTEWKVLGNDDISQAVAKLVGTDTNKSVREIASDEINTKVIAGATSFDTLKKVEDTLGDADTGIIGTMLNNGIFFDEYDEVDINF